MTKAITVNIPHELGRAEARRRIEEGFERFSAQMGGAAGAFTKSWDGNRLSFAVQAMGQAISGSIDVEEASVRLEVLLPNLLALVAGKLKGRLQKEGQILLDHKK
ncbi:polyhydroxyalkanoic acid system family protein [Phenylobacterium sp.]|jgi:ABC-type nitrate/sulfonate/bicarbonate transport system substrate-binding protein|uniref:polyhydroxyalkanoic acid system family protein n=1 Tax=Phenylobacterium sp. TaxID=1871053 RepID=UPI002F948571